MRILYVFPHLDSLGGFWLPFGAGTAVAAYVNFGSPRLSYCGYQIGLAFYKAVLQGYGPATELKVVKDRLIGIALGLLVFGLIDTHLWPVRAAARVRPSFANALRSMADLARLSSQDEDPAMVLSRAYALRLKIYQGFGTVQQLVAETMFEPGTTVDAEPTTSSASGRLASASLPVMSSASRAPAAAPEPPRPLRTCALSWLVRDR